jgi:monoamine oxidase
MMTRRKFLAVTAAARAAAKSRKVIVAGAGISGLSCAYELMKRGHDVTVLEALGRTGGHILTVRDGLADGLYADAGAEHFYQRGYDEFWKYLDEFGLPVMTYPRREAMVRFMGGKPYTQQMLRDRKVLAELGLNRREIDYVARHGWPAFPMLYLSRYLDAFPAEDRPLDAGLNHLDNLRVSDLLRRDGASAAAVGFLGGSRSALETVWRMAVKKLRGVPQYVEKVVRIPGGNQRVTDALAAKLGERVRLGCPVLAIEHGRSGVAVLHREFGQLKKMEAEWLVLALPFRALRDLTVTPAWPEAKRFVIDNLSYDLKARVIFQSRTRFWKRDGVSPNIVFSEQDLADVWAMADEVKTPRGLLIGQARTSASEAALAKFRKLYPGKSEDIEQALLLNWTLDPWAGSCLPLARPPGELSKFWPEVVKPVGRILFAGVACDPLPNGLEAGVRAAKRAVEAVERT